MFSLTEELFLLSLREKRNTISLSYSAALPYALAGAMLVELTLSGKIQFDKDKRVIAIDNPQSEADERMNELLTQIHELAKPRKITYWIRTAVGEGKKFEKKLLATLITRGILRDEEKRLLWVIPSAEYSDQDASAKYLRKQNLRDIILGGKTADQQSIALFSLLKAIDLLDNIFTPDEIKVASSRVNEIVKHESIDDTVIELLEFISSAVVMVALTATDKV